MRMVDNHLSKAMPTMRKVWQVRTTVVRGWRRRGNRKAYLRRICFVFLYLIFIHLYYFLWDYTRITLVGHISSNRHIRQSLVYLLFDSSPDSEDSRYLNSFLFWDRQHRNKWSQKSKIRTKSTSRFDCYFAIYKWQKTNYQGFNLAIQTYIFKYHIIYKFLRKPHHNSCCLYWAN